MDVRGAKLKAEALHRILRVLEDTSAHFPCSIQECPAASANIRRD
jgi:hypothetical protein